MCWVPVTPTRVVHQPAQLEGSNRVLRHLKDFQYRFLCVGSQDEDDELFAGSLDSDVRNPKVGILARTGPVLQVVALWCWPSAKVDLSESHPSG